MDRTFSLNMNRHLWKDENLFNRFFETAIQLNKTVKDQNWNPSIYLAYANQLDDIMQEYENNYESIQDPIFLWSFATANAMFLLLGGKFDELGNLRIAYILNGYREAFSKHERYPSLPKNYIEKAFEHMGYFAKVEDKEWIEKNRDRFIPVLEDIVNKLKFSRN